MALGLLLGVSWICFLLFDGSAAIPAVKGYGYPHTSDSRNIGVDGEDEALTSSNNQATVPMYTNYKKPTFAQQPDGALSRQTLPNTPSGSEVERLINGASRDWGLNNFDKPLTFPLQNNPAKLQPGPAQPLSTSFGISAMNSMPTSESTGGSMDYAGPTAYHAPSSTSNSAQTPSFEHWQHEPVSTGYGDADLNSFSAAEGNTRHLVYEEVFKYPSDNTEPSQNSGAIANPAGGYGNTNYMSEGSSTEFTNTPSFPSSSSNVRVQPVYPSGVGHLLGGANFGPPDYQPRDDSSLGPKKTATQQNVEVTQRVSEPVFPPAPPPSYIVQSKNGYQRSRYLSTQTRYTPEYPPPMPVSSSGVKGPAKPAAPKGGNNPQRTKS